MPEEDLPGAISSSFFSCFRTFEQIPVYFSCSAEC